MNYKPMKQNYFFKSTLVLIVFLVFAFYTNNVFAADSNPDATGIVKIFCNVINQITGGIGKVISILILISMAIGLFLGKITWGLAIAVMVGMGLLFGAKGLVDVIAKGSSAQADAQTNLCNEKN